MGDFATNNDILFRDDLPDVRNNAVLKYCFQQFSFYADGYKIAADRLIKICISERELGRGDIDVLIYPIVFNYRHYIELRLKEIIIGLRYCSGHENVKFDSHNLKTLWDELIILYDDFREENDEEDFRNAERLIHEFDKNDPNSMSFRYPTDKKGNLISIEKINLNIRNFGEVMERLAFFLDSLSDVTENYKSLTDDTHEF
ncbi:hypothetical protein FO440_09250 [Mucilaginibacter corticis]|uniref:HEPN domain-containing protein n=1 Tax=Mucilaginibacter corticis TaxID=2597670 RepID=A0A556MWN2_9SPHI|nr:hypothetical protein [Mucilaginibacter corticis]TSJ44344.1 hypothetical protein FO440_09250 [Mucilaginibacter corticis]